MKFTSPNKPTILCLSHLGWDYVWQRPQHILSRLAEHYPVIYVNEPRPAASSDRDYPENGEPYLKLVCKEDKITAWQPIIPDESHYLNNWREIYLTLVKSLLPWTSPNGHGPAPAVPLILWFYTPTPYYFLEHIPATLVVYDVMDELSNFKGASDDLREREAKVLAGADVVFTGGYSMFQARRGKHNNLHLFPSGVEPEHFARALSAETPVAAEISALSGNGRQPKAILGYYGVIDERMDLSLLKRLAARRPEWDIFMVGPVTKIDESDLPRLPNIHYTGRQPYERLPQFLKGFDVCLMPFALNKATRSISTTKTLEYMAAHKPIVSTPIPDVITNWGHIVRIAVDTNCFIEAVESALEETELEQAVRLIKEKEQLDCHNWESIAAKMHYYIRTAFSRNKSRSYA